MLRRLTELLAPRHCVQCGRRLQLSEVALCAACNLHLPRTRFWLHPAVNPMAQLFWGVVPVERAAALFFYEAHAEAGRMVYDLKYHDRPDIGRAMGRLMGTEMGAARFFSGVDAIVPVPLAKSRQRQRGYNQSRQIAQGVSRATGLPVAEDVVSRTRFERSQTQMARWDRQANVDGVFRLDDADAVRGRHLLLVDDIVTTGATMTACARELLSAGGVRLSLLALAFTRG